MENLHSRSNYFRISCYSTDKLPVYNPKRPNSCEKPRNKRSLFIVSDGMFFGVPIIDFSNVISTQHKSIGVKHIQNSKSLLKSRFITPVNKKPVNPSISQNFPSHRKFFMIHKPLKSYIQPEIYLKNKSLVKILKKSICKAGSSMK